MSETKQEQPLESQKAERVPVVSKYELWSYYAYYNGDGGVGINGYLVPFVSLAMTRAGRLANGAECSTDAAANCYVPLFGLNLLVGSLSNFQTSLLYFITALIMLFVGGLGDYELYGRNLLMFFTIVCITCHLVFIFIGTPSLYVAFFLYLGAALSYTGTLAYFWAAFPRLANHMPEVYEAEDAGKTTAEVEHLKDLARSKLSIVSTTFSNIGYFVPLIICLGLVYAVNPDPMEAQKDYTFNICIFTLGVYWLIFAIPYFILDKKRAGKPIPKGESVFLVGIKEAGLAIKLARKLPTAWVYIVGFFFFAEGVNTAGGYLGGLLGPIQTGFSLVQLTLLGLTNAFSSICGCLLFNFVQQKYGLSTKTMFQFSNIITILMYVYGIFGVFTKVIGYHNLWELYAFQILNGLFSSPFWAYQNTYLSDLVPSSKSYLFFALFALFNKVSAFLGPLIAGVFSSMFANNDNANYYVFIPCVVLALIGFTIIQTTDPEKARAEIKAFEEAEALEMKNL